MQIIHSPKNISCGEQTIGFSGRKSKKSQVKYKRLVMDTKLIVYILKGMHTLFTSITNPQTKNILMRVIPLCIHLLGS